MPRGTALTTISAALRPDTLSDLIIMDKNYHDRVRLRARLLAQQGATVHGCLPRGRDAVREVYGFLLGVFLPRRYPAMFRLSADGTAFQNLVTGASHPLEPPRDAGEALRVIGTTVEEDMFVLSQTPDGHVSDAFVCCFPSGFDPSEKLGKLLRDIHGPVPSYDKIGPSMERFFARLKVGKSVKRSNVSYIIPQGSRIRLLLRRLTPVWGFRVAVVPADAQPAVRLQEA
jgi:hypothetical protein